MALDGALGSDLRTDQVTVPKRPVDRAALEAKLGHVFADKALLERALTHVSAVGGEAERSNQRLEFLGDRVLGLAVSEMLHAAFPTAGEGELSHRLSGHVRREACAAVALAWDLGPQLILGSGEGKAGGRRSVAILADTTEALIGAVFLDAGYAAARAVVEAALAEAIKVPGRPRRDAKTRLQEWSQAGGRPTPVYEVVERSGPDHAPSFTVAARLPDLPPATGTGASRRAAEQEAAAAFLRRESIEGEEDA